MPSFYRLLGVDSPVFDPDHRFVTSWLLSPAALASVRLLFSLYAFLTQFVILGLSGRVLDEQSFSYFTVLTYWGLAFYFLVAGVHTAGYSRGNYVSTPC